MEVNAIDIICPNLVILFPGVNETNTSDLR